MRALKYLLPIIVFAVLVGFLLVGLDKDPREIPSPLIGKPAPVWQLPVLDRPARAGARPGASTARSGEPTANPATTPDSRAAATLASEQLLGTPYLLNVWASWCAPCLQEHPLFVDLARRKLIRLVGFNYKDRPEDARAWLARHGDPYGDIAVDREGRTAIDFGVYGVPETFLIDAEGVIRFKWIGPLTPAALEQKLLPAIRALPPAASPKTGGAA